MEQNNGSKAELIAALVKAQGEFLPIVKNRVGQSGNRTFKYADLDELIQKTRPALVANGLAVIQPIQKTKESHLLVTKLLHASGLMEESVIDMGGHYDDIKVYGAMLTFMRRYAYQAILCISADDDLDDNPEPHAAPKAKPEPKAEVPQEPTFYDQQSFEDNLASWKTAVSIGQTTPERIIKKIESKSRLTDEQRETILSIEVPQA